MMAARYKAESISELVTLTTELYSSLNRFHLENLWCLLIIVRSGPVLMLARVWTYGETHEMLATKLDIADNQCCTSLSGRVG